MIDLPAMIRAAEKCRHGRTVQRNAKRTHGDAVADSEPCDSRVGYCCPAWCNHSRMGIFRHAFEGSDRCYGGGFELIAARRSTHGTLICTQPFTCSRGAPRLLRLNVELNVETLAHNGSCQLTWPANLVD